MFLVHTDALARRLTEVLRGGDIEGLVKLLEANPGLATARIADEHGAASTPLHRAIDWPGHHPRNLEAIRVLVDAGADLDAPMHREGQPSESPETPLHWAASNNDVAALDLLLDLGADIDAPGAVITGGTALSAAVIFSKWACAHRLLERGAATTLWQSAALGALDRLAQQAETASPDALTNAFWHACRNGQLEAAKLLLPLGADRFAIGHEGRDALTVAAFGGHAPVIAWLQSLPER